jgi:hypothetical protein
MASTGGWAQAGRGKGVWTVTVTELLGAEAFPAASQATTQYEEKTGSDWNFVTKAESERKIGSAWHWLSCALKGGMPRRCSGRQRSERCPVQGRGEWWSARAAVFLRPGYGEASAAVGKETGERAVVSHWRKLPLLT